MDEEGVKCMIDAFLHFPNVTSIYVFVEVETRETDVNFESGHPSLLETSYPINIQLSMAFSAPLSQCQDVNISEHHDAFHTSYVASVTPMQPSRESFDHDAMSKRDNLLIKDVLSNIS